MSRESRRQRHRVSGGMAESGSERATDHGAVLATMVDRIAERFDPDRILLFGSRARGESTEWSDFDLLVVMPDGTDRHQTAVDIRIALNDLPAAKDIIVTTPDHIRRRGDVIGTVLRPALREGKVIFERT